MLVEEAPPGFGVPLKTAGKDRHGPGCRGAGVRGVGGGWGPVMNRLRLVQAFNTCCVPTRFTSYTEYTTCDNNQLLQRSSLCELLWGPPVWPEQWQQQWGTSLSLGLNFLMSAEIVFNRSGLEWSHESTTLLNDLNRIRNWLFLLNNPKIWLWKWQFSENDRKLFQYILQHLRTPPPPKKRTNKVNPSLGGKFCNQIYYIFYRSVGCLILHFTPQNRRK